MPSPDPAETTIIAEAQEFVQTWLRDPRRLPFSRAVRIAERRLWNPLQGSDLQREAFRKVANAMRVGAGHAHTNPQPLLKIVRTVLARQRHDVMKDSKVENQ